MPALDRPDNLPMFIATVWTVNREEPNTFLPHVRGCPRDLVESSECWCLPDRSGLDLDGTGIALRYDRRIERGRALSADEFRRELLAESADDEITIGVVSLSKRQ